MGGGRVVGDWTQSEYLLTWCLLSTSTFLIFLISGCPGLRGWLSCPVQARDGVPVPARTPGYTAVQCPAQNRWDLFQRRVEPSAASQSVYWDPSQVVNPGVDSDKIFFEFPQIISTYRDSPSDI